MPSARAAALSGSLDEGPVDVDVLAEQVGPVELVLGCQGFLIGLVLDQSVSLQKTCDKMRFSVRGE